MTATEQKKAAEAFAKRWKDKGYEKGESQQFWTDLLEHVYGVENAAEYITFEEQVKLDKKNGFIDGMISSTKVMIEQKSIEKSLNEAIKQSDGTFLSPFQQAKRYASELPVSQHPRFIITCNFKEFYIYDMEQPHGEPEIILLKDFAKEYYRLQFLVDSGSELLKQEMEISMKAGEIVGKLYDAFLKQYANPEDKETLKSLNKLCVRLVFCLYAEDAGIFGGHTMFHDYLKQYDAKHARKALIELFQVLDTKPENRDKYLDADLAAFPYVNGGLFADENIEIPNLTDEIMDLILRHASEDFDWSGISPTIFGSVFESTLNPETRRSGGMHYTSIENIHKVINPLFLDGLWEKFSAIKEIGVQTTRKKRLKEFQDELAALCFLDPACGSGNFLTESYISLRRLENETLAAIIEASKGQVGGQMMLGSEGELNPIKVSIGQFYGIEINDFAVTVAKTALWIAESQMMQETERLMQISLDFLPLKSYANIVEGNALSTDWETVVPKEKLSYIMGNPPFVGHQFRNEAQADDMSFVFREIDKHGKLDYVCAWYKLACDMMLDTPIKAAFVSTNSISQGESVGILWKYLIEKRKIEIQFAYRSFIWDSEANLKAHVHCVIIGFTCRKNDGDKILYENGSFKRVNHINGYLVDADDVFLQSRSHCVTAGLPEMTKGSQPTDGGFFFLTEDEKNEMVLKYPSSSVLIRQFIGAKEFIDNKKRYCLWLKDVSPSTYKSIPPIMERLKSISETRSKSPTASVRECALTPTLFTQIRQPDTDYMIIPRHSSENRKYIPFGFMSKQIIVGDACSIIPNATLYMFGILTSNVHMAWMRTVCGRLKSDYRYSPSIYNNFPWCNPTLEQKIKIEQAAQAILDARALYPDCSLSELYDELTMPPELRKAHQANDKAVMQAYGFWGKLNSESECVAALMKMYQALVEKER